MTQSKLRWVMSFAAALSALGLIQSPRPAEASDLERRLEARWRGAWILTNVDTYSDCAGTHTNNRVNETLVTSRGRMRFRPGELAQVVKVDLKRARLDLLLSLPEPILVSSQDGPFTLYNEVRCLMELEVELPREVVSRSNLDGIDTALHPILKRHTSQDEAMQAKAWNHRKCDAYPADYDETLAEHNIWKAEQANTAVRAKIDKAMAETSRLADRVSVDADYLKGFAAGIEAMRAVDLGRCGDLMSRDFTTVAPAPARVSLAAFAGEAANRYTSGYQDGQRLVFGLESLRRLPQCLVPVPERTRPH
jgi:hypothetical protein